jgi:hypothetical protein
MQIEATHALLEALTKLTQGAAPGTQPGTLDCNARAGR